MNVRTIPSTKENGIRHVAAYARVSTLQEEQDRSFISQKEYYEKLIRSNSNWKYAGVYADQGLSGTTKNRPQFTKMIADAKDGRIDLILVKSISRFARNGADTQKIIHDLKAHNVEVYFEEQSLSSFNRNAEMVLNMLAMVAENESRSISQNTRWAFNRLAEQGIRHIGNNMVFGYDEIDGVLVPNENSKYVKFIFEQFAEGKSCSAISKQLNEMGVRSLHGDEQIKESTIRYMLNNEIYCGDRLIQKRPPRDMFTKQPISEEEYNSYYIENHHEPIISKELWNKTQIILEQKKQERDHGVFRKHDSHPLYGKIFCGCCGAPYIRIPLCHGEKTVWKCRERVKGKHGNGCKNCILKEEQLLSKLGISETSDNLDRITMIIVEDNGDLTIEQ